MKKVFSVLCALVVLSMGAFAQGPQGPRRGADNGWRERVRAEKVAFLTEEIDLTESEAQVFWPIYNEIQKSERDSFEAVKKAYDAMAKGVEEKKSSKEMEKLVKAYIDAKEKNEGIETKYLNKLLKVLPAEKVARYYVAEEKFRDRPPRKRQLPQPPHERRAEAAVEGAGRADARTVPQLDRPESEERRRIAFQSVD